MYCIKSPQFIQSYGDPGLDNNGNNYTTNNPDLCVYFIILKVDSHVWKILLSAELYWEHAAVVVNYVLDKEKNVRHGHV